MAANHIIMFINTAMSKTNNRLQVIRRGSTHTKTTKCSVANNDRAIARIKRIANTSRCALFSIHARGK